MLRNAWSRDGLTAVGAIVAAFVAGAYLVAGMKLNVDETFHYPQIQRFLAHDFSPSDSVTQLPGYHYAVFAVASVLGVSSVAAIRAISIR